MSAEDVQVASRFLAALEAAARSGDREAVYPLLAPDVEWVIPQRTLRGVEELKEKHTWGSPRGDLEVEFEADEWIDLGDGRVTSEVREHYRWKETGEVAQQRDRRIELTIRDGKIARYEMHIVG
jgi:ketosteroid isomerase-like protein